ncbi:unnamed protein product, partial [Symbiodinium sp. CCMP2592]
MSGTTAARKPQTPQRKVPVTWGGAKEKKKTTRTIGDGGDHEPAIDATDDDVSSIDNPSSSTAAFCSNTSRSVLVGGKTYVWPKRVVIVGYGVAAHGNRPSPQMADLLERLDKESNFSNKWEVRLQVQMHVSKLHDICTFFIHFSFTQLTIEGSDSDSHGWKPREAEGGRFGRECGLYQHIMEQ